MSQEFFDKLALYTDRLIRVRINDNRRTMLSVSWEGGETRVSLHRMFISAPDKVIKDLCYYLEKPRRRFPKSVKIYMNQQHRELDYSDRISETLFEVRGKTYDLKKLYDEVNVAYFDNELKLRITWSGDAARRRKSSITFGEYCNAVRLVKVHRALDCEDVPEYVVRFIIYHEMLHSVCQPEVTEAGTCMVHTKAFTAREKQFREYKQATKWLNQHKRRFFGYGWT